VVYLGAEPVKQATLRVERFSYAAGAVSEAEEAVSRLEHECAQLKNALRARRLAAEAMQSG
jgi:hypothetical protein